MPAFSYKERFVPFIKNFTKTGTIRAFRKYPIKVGQMSYHYFGMRTKYCTRLISPQVIKSVKTIWIFSDGSVYLLDNQLSKSEALKLMRNRIKLSIVAKLLSVDERNQLAWNDGFQNGMTKKDSDGCFWFMINFWKQTHELPFTGQYIKWR